MIGQTAERKSIRVGVFDSVPDADQAVHHLLSVGFTKKEIGVLCSLESAQASFPDFAKPHLARVHTSETIPVGGAIGAGIGGLALVVLAATTGGVGAVIGAGAILVGGGALAGIFAGAIYGVEEARGEYYDQVLKEGKILVAVDLEGHEDADRFAQAELILREEGAVEVKPIGYP